MIKSKHGYGSILNLRNYIAKKNFLTINYSINLNNKNQLKNQSMLGSVRNELNYPFFCILKKHYFKKTNPLSMRNYYRILGVVPNSTERDIKNAFFKLAKEKHPDIDPSPTAVINFNLILEAYNVLSDEKQREKYDSIFKSKPIENFEIESELGKEDKGNSVLKVKPGEYKYPINRNFVNESKENFQFENDFRSAYAQYEYMLGDLWEKERFDTKYVLKDFSKCPTNDNLFIEKTIEISLKDYLSGKTISFDFERMRKCYNCSGLKYNIDSEMTVCKNCNGTGKIMHKALKGLITSSSTCNVCKGLIYSYSEECELCEKTGVIPENIRREITLEPRFPINKAFYILEIGNYLTSNVYGALRLRFKIAEESNLFKIDENYNILATVFISLSTAILGGEVDYLTINGIQKLKVPQKSQDGDLIKFENKGIKYLDENGQEKIGNHIITLKVIYPKKYNHELREIMKNINV